MVPFAAFTLSLTSTASAGTPRFAYVPNIDDGTISEFIVNASTGQLLPNGYVTAGDHPRSFVKVGNFAYVANQNSGDISAYSLDPNTGQLEPLSTPTFLAPGDPFALIAHPNGHFLYAVDSLGGSVYTYKIATDGSLTQIGNTTAGSSPRFLAITGSGNFLYVANFVSNNVTAFKVNANTGQLTTVGTFATGGSKPSNVMTSGSFLFVTNSASNNVAAFVINAGTGALTHVSGSPFATGTSPYALTREFNGHFIYVGNSLSNNISAFKVNQTTGALTHVTGSPFAATKGTQALKVDPSNKFLYAADAGAEEAMVYSMNLTTGALTNTSSMRTHGIGFDIYVTNGIAISSKPAFAYFLAQDITPEDPDCPWSNCNVPEYVYRINPSTGGLSQINTFVTSGLEFGLTSTPIGLYFYDTDEGFDSNFGGTDISNASDTSGIYEEDDHVPVFDFQSRFQYASNDGNGSCYQFYPCLDEYAIDPQTGNFTELSSQNLGDAVGFDLSGKFLYGHDAFGTFTVFKVNPSDGSLSYSTQATNADYVPGTMHPSGRFFYAPTAGGVLAVAMRVTTGALSTLSFSPGSSANPMVENSGKFAYLPVTGGLGIYKINQTTGKLTHVATTSNVGTMDASGSFLMGYSNAGPIKAWTCKINHTTGAVAAPTQKITLPSSFISGGITYHVGDYSRATTRIVN